MKKVLLFLMLAIFTSCGVSNQGSTLKPMETGGYVDTTILGGKDFNYESTVKISIERDGKSLASKDYPSKYGDSLQFSEITSAEYKDKVIIEVSPSEAHEVAVVRVDGEDVVLNDNKLILELKEHPKYEKNYHFYDVVVFFRIKSSYLEQPLFLGKLTFIRTAKQLRWIAAKAQNGMDFEGYTIKLGNDIDMENINFTGIATGGLKGVEFKGTFDGAGYEIKNLHIKMYDDFTLPSILDAGINPNIGLIGLLGKEGVVKNVTVSGRVNGIGNVAGIVGFNLGTIAGVTNNASVKSLLKTAGGIYGYNDGGTVGDDCINNGEITIIFK